MLDTIALMLPEYTFRLCRPEKFSPHAYSLRNASCGGGMVKAIYNPTKSDTQKGYKPRLTLYRRPAPRGLVSIFMRVEFSAPKLVFGNNFQELRGSDDFQRVIDALHGALHDMGVEITKAALKAANISAIHYSKNILLEKHTPCFLLIQELEKLDLSQKLDLTQTDFRNAGQMVKYHASTYEIALYDKVKDLEQASKYGERRGAEMDYECQRGLLRPESPLPEVLRFEIRLTSKKLKSLLKTLKEDTPLTLESLFSPSLSRSILLYFWAQITDGLYGLTVDARDAASLIQSIRTVFPRKRPGKVAEMTGFLTACQQIGFRGAALALGMKTAQLYRLKKDIKALEQAQIQPRFSVLNLVKNELVDFIPLTAADIVRKDLLKAV